MRMRRIIRDSDFVSTPSLAIAYPRRQPGPPRISARHFLKCQNYRTINPDLPE